MIFSGHRGGCAISPDHGDYGWIGKARDGKTQL